jgi:hypothetical protein
MMITPRQSVGFISASSFETVMSETTGQSDNEQSFLGRVFDSYQNMMQIAACIRETARQRSIPEPRILELSRVETDLTDYLPEAQILRYPTHENNQTTLGLPVVLPFADNSFDGCLITDVYEHIPAQLRPGILREMLRVTDGLVLVASPQGNEVVTRFDRIVFDFIWGKYGERFEPLEQHMKFGLEPLEQTLESLKAQGADRVIVLPGNYVYRWIHMILIYFDQQHRNDYGQLFEPFNRVYNERLSPYDYREPCYRYLIAIATHSGVDVDALHKALQRPTENLRLAGETDGVLVQTFREIEATAADQLRRCAKEMNQLYEEKEDAAQELEARAAEITALKSKFAAHEGEISALRNEFQVREDETKELKNKLEESQSETALLRSELAESQGEALVLRRELAAIQEQIASRQHKMQQLKALSDERERALTDILNSKSFQITVFYGRMRRAVRRLFRQQF